MPIGPLDDMPRYCPNCGAKQSDFDRECAENIVAVIRSTMAKMTAAPSGGATIAHILGPIEISSRETSRDSDGFTIKFTAKINKPRHS